MKKKGQLSITFIIRDKNVKTTPYKTVLCLLDLKMNHYMTRLQYCEDRCLTKKGHNAYTKLCMYNDHYNPYRQRRSQVCGLYTIHQANITLQNVLGKKHNSLVDDKAYINPPCILFLITQFNISFQKPFSYNPDKHIMW